MTPNTPTSQTPEPSIQLVRIREGAFTKVSGDGLTGLNWVTWRVRMWSLLAFCKVESYVRGEIQQPNLEDDPVGYNNWKDNDNYAKHLIFENVGDESIVHIQHDSTSHLAWEHLEAIHKEENAAEIMRNFWHTTAEEDDDMSEHLATLKKYWEHLNLVDNNDFKIPEVLFKLAIVSSLPPSWDSFTQPYISINMGDNFGQATSQEPILGILKEDSIRRLRRAGKFDKTHAIHQNLPPSHLL